MNNFGQIVKNVGIRVGDTSSSFATVIGGYVNQRYGEVFERYDWGIINDSWGFNLASGEILTEDSSGLMTETGSFLMMDGAVGVMSYQLPSDFFKPLYCYDMTNSLDIPEYSMQDIEREYAATLKQTGSPIKYAIFNKVNSTTKALEKWIRFYPMTTSPIAILMPYLVAPGTLSADTDLMILDCDYEVELGATAEAWRTKRQFAKAADFDKQFDEHIMHMIWRRENQPNKITQFRPQTFDRNSLY